MAEPERSPDFLRRVADQAGRRRHSRDHRPNPLWVGLGSFGVVGWSVAVPTLLGIAAGLWLDRILDDRVSWTLTGLFAGAAIGSLVAWLWVSRTGRGKRR